MHHYDNGSFYLIRYKIDHSVEVTTYSSALTSAVEFGRQEQLIECGQDDANVVLVEVDKVGKLVDTYPNYFGDVSLFVTNLRKLCDGQDAIEYHMAPQKVVAPKPQEKPNLDALARRYTRWA